MKKLGCFIVICLTVSACEKGGTIDSFTIPSDPKGVYVVLEKSGEGNERTILTKREGPSGTTYSKRLYNCAENTVKYLGTGSTMEAMNASPADPNMAPITDSSIAHYLGLKACA